jgi:D-alanine-D-alanine ligase-like ATP-grasp enzyme
MKILVLEPAEPDDAEVDKTGRVLSILNQLGHEVLEALPDALLYEQVIKRKPDVVFNLASAYEAEKANRVPVVLEIADVSYTGSGILGLSLNRFYNLLFPLLAASGVQTVPFKVMKAGQFTHPDGLGYPLTLFREGARLGQVLENEDELKTAMRVIAPREDVIVFGFVKGEKESLFILDSIPFLTSSNSPCLEPALKTYALIEARGLARFDFVRSDSMLLSGIDSAPDSLGEQLLRDAAAAGWDEERLIQYMVEHAGRD